MKQIKKSFNVSGRYTVKGLKGRDYCTCFHENVWGVLKNGLGIENKDVKGYFYSKNTIDRCNHYLFKFFNEKFGKVWTDKRKSVWWNWANHPEYLYYIHQTKEWMKRVNNAAEFDDQPELSNWLKTLPFDQQAIVISYWLIINR